MLLSDIEIRVMCVGSGMVTPHGLTTPILARYNGPPLIDPFSEAVQDGVISYGLSSAGYDLRLGPEVMMFKNTYNEVIHPKRFKDPNYRKRVFDEFIVDEEYGKRMLAIGLEANAVIIPANSYMLGRSLEYLRFPKQLKGRCVGKSTLARCGILVNTTPIEPEWEGHLTIEISNVSPAPACVFVGEGVAQLEFEVIQGQVGTTYKDKQGKYQATEGVAVARIKE